jgi:LytS/YehU family sensor histidine kinase
MLYIIVSGFLIIAVTAAWLFLRRKNKFHAGEEKIPSTDLQLLTQLLDNNFLSETFDAVSIFIRQNKNERSDEILGRAGRYIKSVLNFSVNKEISLSEELNLIELYLGLEEIRLQKKFRFHIIIEPEVLPQAVMIPPLYILPCVRDAVVNALAVRKDAGTLYIAVSLKSSSVVIIIDDDGIKRTADFPWDDLRIISLRIAEYNIRKTGKILFNNSNKDSVNRIELHLPYSKKEEW